MCQKKDTLDKPLWIEYRPILIPNRETWEEALKLKFFFSSNLWTEVKTLKRSYFDLLVQKESHFDFGYCCKSGNYLIYNCASCSVKCSFIIFQKHWDRYCVLRLTQLFFLRRLLDRNGCWKFHFECQTIFRPRSSWQVFEIQLGMRGYGDQWQLHFSNEEECIGNCVQVSRGNQPQRIEGEGL